MTLFLCCVGLSAGQCLCKEGFAGDKCDRCAFGYRDFPFCTRCECNLDGSHNIDPCRECVCKVRQPEKHTSIIIIIHTFWGITHNKYCLFVCLTFSSSVRVCVRRLMWWAQTVTCVSRASLTCRPVILKDVLSVFVLESQTCARAQSGSLARYIHTYTHTTFCRQNAIRKLYWLNVTVVTSYLILKWRRFKEWMMYTVRWSTETVCSCVLLRLPASSHLPSQRTTSSCLTLQRPRERYRCGHGPLQNPSSITRWPAVLNSTRVCF